MAIDAAQFQVNYPEFGDAPPAVVTQYLADAYLLTPSGVWSTYTDLGAQLRCAQALALSPFARQLNLRNEDGTTPYDKRLRDLVQMVAAGGSNT